MDPRFTHVERGVLGEGSFGKAYLLEPTKSCGACEPLAVKVLKNEDYHNPELAINEYVARLLPAKVLQLTPIIKQEGMNVVIQSYKQEVQKAKKSMMIYSRTDMMAHSLDKDQTPDPRRPDSKFPEWNNQEMVFTRILTMFYNLVTVVHAMNEKNMYHNDIKPANVFYVRPKILLGEKIKNTTPYRMLVGDFGGIYCPISKQIVFTVMYSSYYLNEHGHGLGFTKEDYPALKAYEENGLVPWSLKQWKRGDNHEIRKYYYEDRSRLWYLNLFSIAMTVHEMMTRYIKCLDAVQTRLLRGFVNKLLESRKAPALLSLTSEIDRLISQGRPAVRPAQVVRQAPRPQTQVAGPDFRDRQIKRIDEKQARLVRYNEQYKAPVPIYNGNKVPKPQENINDNIGRDNIENRFKLKRQRYGGFDAGYIYGNWLEDGNKSAANDAAAETYPEIPEEVWPENGEANDTAAETVPDEAEVVEEEDIVEAVPDEAPTKEDLEFYDGLLRASEILDSPKFREMRETVSDPNNPKDDVDTPYSPDADTDEDTVTRIGGARPFRGAMAAALAGISVIAAFLVQ